MHLTQYFLFRNYSLVGMDWVITSAFSSPLVATGPGGDVTSVVTLMAVISFIASIWLIFIESF